MKTVRLLFLMVFLNSWLMTTYSAPINGAAAESKSKAIASGLSAYDLRCEYLVNPIGINDLNPRLSWKFKSGQSTERDVRQTSYQVIVASSSEMLLKNDGDLWDSGRIESGENINITYNGKPLRSLTDCRWKLRVWDNKGRASAWSESCSWKMGLLGQNDWQAKWISTAINRVAPLNPGNKKNLPPDSLNAPYIRRTFNLDALPESAFAMVNVLGFYELYVNGTKVGTDVLSPAVTNYDKRSMYVTYDLKPYLRRGKNAVGLWTSRGWYRKMLDSRRNPAVHHSSAIVRLQIDMIVKGERVSIGTDSTWCCKASGRYIIGPWNWNNMGGELVDARLEDNQWDDPATDDSSWFPVSVVPAPTLATDAQKSPLTRILKTLPAISCDDLGNTKYELMVLPGISGNKNQTLPWNYAGKSRYEVDFGTNLTGWLKIRFHGLKEGQEVTIRYADKKNPYQTYNQIDRFISSGRPEEEFCSKFNYHGFRWALIEGLAAPPGLKDAEALAIGADFEICGKFKCSNSLINRMHEVNLWTIHSLSQCGFFSDCPHRERLGYGDGQVSVESSIMNFQMETFYDKWATDWCDGANSDNGYLPHTAPHYKSGGGGPAWGGSAQALTWRNYLYYADKLIVARNYEACRRHIEAIEGHAKEDIVRFFGGQWDFIGDWVPPERGMDTPNWPSRLAAELFNNCYRLYLREQLAQMADILDRKAEAAACRAELQRLRPLIHSAFYDKVNKTYVIDEQTYQIMPLMTGVVPEELRETILKKLENGILVNRKGHLDTGMLGTYFLLNYLQELGRNDLLFKVVSQTTYPGWGFMLAQGATTWWEQWNGFWSQIHSCFTSLDGWFYQGLAGIRPDPAAPGFRKIIIKPSIVGDLTWVKAQYDSNYGPIVSHWERKDSQILLHIVIPPNTTATVYVPANDTKSIKEGNKPALKSEGVRFLRQESGATIFEVVSGTYDFTSSIRK